MDIDDRFERTNSPVGKKILAAVRNTMSDKAACEKKFNRLVEDLINELIPQIEGLLPEMDSKPMSDISGRESLLMSVGCQIFLVDVRRVIILFEEILFLHPFSDIWKHT